MNEDSLTNKINSRIQHLDKTLNRPSLVFGYFTHNLLTDHKLEKLKISGRFILDNFTQKDLETPVIKLHVHTSTNAIFKGCLLEEDPKTTIQSGRHSWISDKGQENQIIIKSFEENTFLKRNRRLIIDHILIELPVNTPHHLSLSAYIDFGKNSRYSKHSLNSIEVNSMEIT
ncbi:hypothetical protein [Halobacillus amylolyticus]|uniref:Uncharacterized protein n=1 Tax=Halobacillus amylolyticus TaxID=2932259 RepID=A0ABY4HGT1_9BACI|nr:hypothetical protein [Halobacillus amylolyticus]UOR13065.1 hypothetical protein MUO15_06090 [Halobacillus amylolyticus]